MILWVLVFSCFSNIFAKEQDSYCSQFSQKNKNKLWKQLQYYKPQKDRPIAVVIPSYNNKDWYQQNLDSVFMQNYNNFHVYYIDDCSPDGTGLLVENYIKKNKKNNLVTIIKNNQRQGALCNYYNVIHSLSNEGTIVVILDGDDWFANDHVLSLLNKVYDKYDIWITYGSYVEYPSGKQGRTKHAVPVDVIRNNSIRYYKWVTSHIRTFYAWLFKCIKKEDLLFEDKFLPYAGDVGTMIPMMEMAGVHSKYIPDINYVYNRANCLNVGKVNPGYVQHGFKNESTWEFFRKKERYKPLNIH